MSTSAVAALLVFALVGVKACILPPHGCLKQVCAGYTSVKVPPNSGDFSAISSWATWTKLAFIRTSFNKQIGDRGPSSFSATQWLDLLNGYGKVKAGPPALPSLQYEFFDLSNGVSKTQYSTGKSLRDCCDACRLSYDCPLYAFVPSTGPGSATTSGTCYFVKGGPAKQDGPFDFVNGTDGKSARTKNLGAPKAYPGSGSLAGYTQAFLGGYCNPWKYPNSTVTDDPHFTGAHGTRFDFNGELNKAFCLLTDSKLSINAVLKGYKSDNTFGATEGEDGKALRSWIKELGFVWTDDAGAQHTLHLVARNGKEQTRNEGFLASAKLDGSPITVPASGDSFRAGELTFSFQGTTKKGWYDMDVFRVMIGDRVDLTFHMRVAHPKLQTPTDAEAHFNVMLNNVHVTDKVHGVLGQTYRNSPSQVMKALKFRLLNRLLGGPVKADGDTGAGFLEGDIKDYETSGVLQADCKVSSYDM